MVECVPVPLPDEVEAGSLWRDEKLHDFSFRLRCLGLEGDPQMTALLSQIAQQTQELELLAERQRQPDYERPWWQDGEYDSARADSANDRGMSLFSSSPSQPSAAFDCFTEAIRLCPSSAVYHCNRAAAALKLGKPGIAAADADAALQRDPGYARAHLRAGRARLLLGQADVAVHHFRAALQLNAGSAAARRGLAEAEAQAEALRQQAESEAAAASMGSRPGLPRTPVPESEAASLLLTAEQMLAANPRLQAAKCARVEALLLCQRCSDAAEACRSLLAESADRLYLEAEVAWRQGGLAAAAKALRQALAVTAAATAAAAAAGGAAAGSNKCCDLLAHVETLQRLEEEAIEDLQADRPQGCAERCTELLGLVHPAACTGLATATLQRRAEAQIARGLWLEAVEDLSAALALEGGHAGCLQLRAEAHKHLGDYTACFLDLQRLKKAAPGTPGLLALLEEAARLNLGGGGGRGGGGSSRAGGGERSSAGASPGAAAALGVLGLLGGGATAAQVRQAYLRLAARWHPDKWVGGSVEERAAAEERFKEVQRAYDQLQL